MMASLLRDGLVACVETAIWSLASWVLRLLGLEEATASEASWVLRLSGLHMLELEMATAVAAAAAAAPTAYPPSACDCAWAAPPTACDGGDDGSICWRECCISRRAPRAHLITDGGERGNRSEALLRRLGFDVRLVRPITAARDSLDARLLSQRRTQQAILATIVPSPARAFEYIFEDDVALHRTVPEASLMPLVRAAESHALTSSASARMTAQRAGTACGCWKRRHEGRDSSGWPARGHEA